MPSPAVGAAVDGPCDAWLARTVAAMVFMGDHQVDAACTAG